MFGIELKTPGLEEAIKRLEAWNAARAPVIRKAANEARRRMRTIATGLFEFRVDPRRRTRLKSPVTGVIEQFPDRLILKIGSRSTLVAYHERGEHRMAVAGRRAHTRTVGGRTFQVRQHPLRLDITDTHAIRSAAVDGAPRLADDIARRLRQAFDGGPRA